MEREREAERIEDALADVSAGRGRALLVEGDPGSGRSAVLGVVRESARGAGLLVLTARGSTEERQVPYGVCLQLFEALLEEEPPGGRTAERVRALLEPAGRPTEAEVDALVRELHRLTLRLAARSPLALVVDDLQWADEPSLRFLTHLANRLDDRPVLLAVAMTAPHTDGPAARAADLLARLAPTASLWLAPLTPAGTETVVRGHWPEPPRERFATVCHELTGGNPLLLRELCAEAAGDGIEPDPAHLGRLRTTLPRGVVRRTRLRLAGLSREAARLAEALAVFGDSGATVDEAARAADLPPDAAHTAAAEAVAAGLLRDEEHLRLAQPLLRTAVLALTPQAVRERAHGAAARALAARNAPLPAVGEHLLHTPPAGDPWAESVLRGAARQAVTEGRADRSVLLLRRALREQAPATREYDLLAELGAAALAAGSPEALAYLRQALEKAPSPATRVATGLHYAHALAREHRHPAALSLLGELAAALPGGDERLRTRLDAVTALLSLGQVETRAGARALVHSRYPARSAAGPDATLLRALRLVVDRDNGATASTLVRQVGSMLRITQFPVDGLTGLPSVHLVVCVLAATGRLSEARGLLLDTLPHSTDLRAAEHQPDSVALHAMLSYGLGRLDEAERQARAVLALRARGWPPGMGVAVASSVLGHVLLDRGETEAAERVLRDGVPPGKLPGHLLFSPTLEARARLCAESGRLDEALEVWRHARRLTSDGRLGLRVTGGWHHVALALIVAGREDEAAPVLRLETETAQEFGAAVPLALAHRVNGALRGGSRGVEELQRAVTLLQSAEQPLELAAALVQLGSAERRSGQRAAARRSLCRGREIARERGAAVLADLADTELRVLGSRGVRGGNDRLTPSERRVAELASTGLSNREIARGLYVSVKTVEWHLSHVYRKLGVRSRRELAPALARSAGRPDGASAHQRTAETAHGQQDPDRRDAGARRQRAQQPGRVRRPQAQTARGVDGVTERVGTGDQLEPEGHAVHRGECA